MIKHANNENFMYRLNDICQIDIQPGKMIDDDMEIFFLCFKCSKGGIPNEIFDTFDLAKERLDYLKSKIVAMGATIEYEGRPQDGKLING